jgi:hypothetical protein
MTIPDEIQEKERRVREFLRTKNLQALLLKRQANFSWLTGGGLNLVGITTEVGATSLLITENEKFVISNNIEAPRMVAEERLETKGFQVRSFPWYEDRELALVREIVGLGSLGCDVPFPNAVVLAEEIARLRYALTSDEMVRYRWLGEKVSAALERTMLAVEKGEKESEAVGRLCNELWKDRIDPVTLMSAADERIADFRHPIPTEKRVERILMISVNARKWGLIVSLQKGIEAYRAKGYPEEWKLHHQGGSIGYTGRDYRVHFQTMDVIQENQAFTWNPSLPGMKSEDTILASSRGVEMITKPILYPTLAVQVEGLAVVRPDILEKG